MKFWKFYCKISFLKFLPSLLFFSLSFPNFSQEKKTIIPATSLEAEKIVQKEFSPKRIKTELLNYSKISKEELAGFKDYATKEYSRDKNIFFTDFTSGKIDRANIPSYFSFLRAKYVSLFKQFRLQNGNDDFTLAYKKGIGGGDEVKGPGQPCNNMDIEQCSFNSWDLYMGDVPGTSQYSYTNVVTTTPGTQHIITNAGNDPIVPVSMIYPDGGTCSARIGDGAGTGAKAASMKQTFLVDSNNAVFTYSYAVILEDPQHPVNDQPYFRVRIYDSNGVSIPCGEYNVNAGPVNSGGDPDFIVVGGISYKDWTTVFAPLNSYIGQNVTAEFVVGDCAQGGHFGYAYVEASCMPLEIIASSPVICGGQAVTLTAPPGAATYAWTGPNGFTANTQSITTSTPGTYDVTVTPVSGSACAITISITLPTNPSIPVADFTASTPCIGNPTNFTDISWVNPGTITNWHWDFGVSGVTNDTSNLQNPTYIYTTAGNYNVTLDVTTSAGCVQSIIKAVNVIAGFDATFTPDTFCLDEPPINLSSVNPGGTWSGPGITNSSNGTFNPTTSGQGTFSITYIGGTGACMDTFIADVIVDAVTINSITTINIDCFGDNDGAININATGATQYTINNGGGPVTQSNGNFTNLTPGTYNITVTSAINNCQKTSSATITEPPLLVMAFQTFDVVCYNACNGEAIAIPSGGTSPYDYNWSSGSPNAATTGKTLCDGSYTLSIIDAKNCVADTTFVIAQPMEYSVVLTTVNSNCGHPDGSAEIISISGQTPAYSYSWSNNDPDSSATNIVNGNYSVTITDVNGCDTVLSAVVGYNPPPDASAFADTTSCFGTCDGNATVVASNGTTPGIYTYLWNNGQSTPTANLLCAGSYTVTVFDANLCEGYASVVVQQPTPVDIAPLPDDTICIDSTGTINAIASGGTPPYTYNWDNGMTGSTNPVFPVSQTCYTVTATDANGCVSNPRVQCISIFPPLNVFASGSATICEGGSSDISAFAFGGNPNNLISYSWSNNVNAQSQTVTPSGNNPSTITYTVTASDGCAPPVSDSVQIDFYLQPRADLVADTLVGCEPVPEFTVTFSNISTNLNNPISCIWSIGDGSQPIQDCDTFIHNFPNVGQYDVSLTVISGDACQSSITKTGYIKVNPNPTADFIFSPQPTDVQNMTINFTDLSTGLTIDQWEWSFFDNDATTLLGNGSIQNPSFNFSSDPDNPFIYYLSDTGLYPVTLWIKTDNNCKDSITKEVQIDGVFYVNVPNAFTPNNDGINDFFFPSGVGIQPSQDFRFIILNRWGDIIFESKSLDDPWDGTARSLGGKNLVKQDVYVWKLELRDVTREQLKHKYVGHVTLLK